MATYTCRLVCSDGDRSVEIGADDMVSLFVQVVQAVWPLPDPDPNWDLDPSMTFVFDISGGYSLTLDPGEVSRLVLDAHAYQNDPTDERRAALQQTIQYLVTERFALGQDTYADLVRAVSSKKQGQATIHRPPVA